MFFKQIVLFLLKLLITVFTETTDSENDQLIYCNDCFFRTEANDLALRLARTYTKHNDTVVLDRFV